MSRRIGFLSLAVVVCGGLLAGLVQTPTTTAQVPGVSPVEDAPPTTPRPPVANAIPAPPARRAEGIFDLHLRDKAEKKIQDALVDPRGVDMQFIDTPLKDAMDFLADQHQITVLIDEQALTEEKVAIDEPLNRTLSGIKLESALKILLEPLGLTHIIEDEVLKITTQSAANEKRSTRVYHTGYLKQAGIEPEALGNTIRAVVEPAQWRTNPWIPQTASQAENQTVASREGEGTVRVLDVQTGKPAFQVNGALLRNVQAGRGPGEGKPKAVGQSSLEVLGDMLVVSAPNDVHEKIRRLLIQLDRRWELEQGNAVEGR